MMHENPDVFTDPVCGMTVDPRDAPEQRRYRGRIYYFCSIGCAGKFGRAPESYVGNLPPSPDTPARSLPQSGTAPIRDPVCGMEVEPHQNALEHEGIHYAFCSSQCRDRFVIKPHLYIGTPGHKAPKQEGKVVMKQRRFRTDVALTAAEADLLRRELAAMMGVIAVEVAGCNVAVTYDLLQTTAEQLEARMAEIGVKLGGAWKERLLRAFVHYLEECEVDNLAAPPQSGHGVHRNG